MNRRGFFAAVLAPLVVPWKPKQYVHWISPWMPMPMPLQWGNSRIFRREFREAQRRMNELYNQQIDNITLGRR